MTLRKISCFLVAAVAAITMCVPAMAAETETISSSIEIDKSDTSGDETLTPEESEQFGSITIQLADTQENLPKEGVKLKVVEVADVVNGLFEIDENYADAGVDLNAIKNANELESAAEKLEKIGGDGAEIVTDKKGVASVAGLHVGVYLVYATDIAGYENIAPLLVSIPTWSDAEKAMKYDLVVEPKHTPLPTPEKPKVPQTGLENNAVKYASISAGCLLAALLVCVTVKTRKSVKR